MTVAATGVFEITPRPPTPPKEHKDHTEDINTALDFLTVDYSLDKPSSTFSRPDSGLSTPPKSSPSVHQDSSARLNKKVGFKYYTVEHAGPSPEKKETDRLRPLPQTRQAKPLRSILKSTTCYTPTPDEDGSSPAGYFSPRKPDSIPKMLDSVVQLLSSSDPILRLDGYQTITGALKAYSEFPSEDALRSRLPQILPSILRDIKSESTGMHQTNLCTQALKLTGALFHVQGLASSLTNEFRAVLLDCALNVLAQSPVNKAVANHYLYLLAVPDFKTRALTPSKADLLLTRLHDIQDRISGNSVIASRLVIYQRLIEQLPSLMLTKIGTWIENVLHGCMSANEDICKRSIECGTKAGLAFGSHYSAMKAMSDVFSSETETYGNYGSYFTARLRDIANDSKRSPNAPRIWSVIILFFRNSKRPISHWLMLKPLLMPIQTCLNSSDIQTKYEAMLAWNRFVFVAGLDSIKTENKLIQMLKLPFANAFAQKCGTEKSAVEARRAIMFGYVNLLYYALQPEQSFERLDFFWDCYAHDLLSKMLKHGGRDGRFAQRILKALLRDGARYWNKDRATDNQPLRPEELVRLDVAWIRSRVSKLLTTMETYIGTALCVHSTGVEVIENPMNYLIASIAEAGAQEVRTSTDTKEALAALLTSLSKTWQKSRRWLQDSPADVFMSRIADLISALVDAFGPRCLLEDFLLLIDQGGLIAAPQIASRKIDGQLLSPFTFLWNTLTTSGPECESGAILTLVETALFRPILLGQTTSLASLTYLRQCTTLLEDSPARVLPKAARRDFCDMLLGATEATLSGNHSSLVAQSRLAQTSRLVVTVLDKTARLQGDGSPLQSWVTTFDTLAAIIMQVAGGAGVNIALVYPFATTLKQAAFTCSPQCRVQLAQSMLTKLTWSATRQQLDRAWKVLEGQQADAAKVSTLLSSWQGVLSVGSDACQTLISNWTVCSSEAGSFLNALRSVIAKCPPADFRLALRILTPGLSDLFRDSNGDLAKQWRQAAFGIWDAICSSVESQDATDDALNAVSGLLVSAITSRHRTLVNRAIDMWNSTFGQQAEVTYPTVLLPVLGQLRQLVEIELPCFPSNAGGTNTIEFPAFVQHESSDEGDDAEQADISRSATPRQSRARSSTPFNSIVRKTPLPGTSEAPSVASRTPQSKALPLPKLRHENSQIEFVNIENLPSELTDDGSQGLTEHQKEVKQKQNEEVARLFPQISSSPAPPSSSTNKLVARINEVMESDKAGRRHRTPEPDTEGDGPMDALVGSSPAARSAQRAQRRGSLIRSEPLPQIDEDVEEIMEDVPSSPPELVEDFEEAASHDELPLPHDGAGDDGSGQPEPEDLPNIQPEAVDAGKASSSPQAEHAQSEQEADDNCAIPSTSSDILKTSEFIDGPTELFNAAPSNADEGAEHPVEHLAHSDDDAARDDEERDSVAARYPSPQVIIDVSRIEDSFVGSSDAGTTLVEQIEIQPESSPPSEPAASPMRTRKRRSSEIQTTPPASKRQKRSPLRKFMSWMGHQEAETAEDDDMEDCIVVASQPPPSNDEVEEVASAQTESQPDASAPPKKRGRGRPRKNPANPRAVAARKATPKRSLKRKSSAISVSSNGDVKIEEIDDSSALSWLSSTRKTRRQTRLHDAMSAARVEERLPATPVEETTVVIPASASSDAQLPSDVEPSSDGPSPDRQLQEEAAAALAKQRVIASPRSIIGRLKSILDDVKEMGKKFVLGSQEEREMAGVIWQLGGEVHAAGQRANGKN